MAAKNSGIIIEARRRRRISAISGGRRNKRENIISAMAWRKKRSGAARGNKASWHHQHHRQHSGIAKYRKINQHVPAAQHRAVSIKTAAQIMAASARWAAWRHLWRQRNGEKRRHVRRLALSKHQTSAA